MQRLVLCLVALSWSTGLSFLFGQSAPANQADDHAVAAREVKIMQRFLSLLERTPRFGTALDKVYGHHVERGTLEDFTRSYYDKTKADPKDGVAWMMLGLVESQRGRDIEAVTAFRQAEQHRPDDPLASYYLGRGMVLIGQPEKSSAAFERAITRKPQRQDLLEIFQALGRSYQRAQRTEDALKVWDRLESQFPEDLRVQEQIAAILEDEGDHEGALNRFEVIAKKSADRYRQVQYGVKAGELKIRLGRQEEAVADFEKLLGELKPDSWLHRDVRERVENVYLRADDYDGLAKYYKQWLAKYPDDTDAMSRLGRTLSFQGRAAEAEEWYARAISLAPTDKRLRQSLIDQLTQAGRYADAVTHYEKLNELDPNNPDNIQRWGELILKDKQIPESDRRRKAAAIWRMLLADKPGDPVVVSQVADMLRHAKMTDKAIDLYSKAVELAPGQPQYREYLGEYFHVLERSDDAKATWKEIATGKKRTTKNLVRLAEVYHGFGYREEAVKAMGDACAMDPEFTDRVRFAQMLRDVEQFDEGLKQLNVSEKLVETDEEGAIVLDERIRIYTESGALPNQIAELSRELNGGTNATANRWRILALYHVAANQLDMASKAIQSALQLDEESIPVWTIAAKIYEDSGNFGDATAANRKLAAIDRRYRTEYLQKIAGLEMRLGRVDEALAAARDMITSAPGNPEHYRFFADLCFQVGRSEDGLDALRRSVRVNPSDLSALMTLASALAEQFRTDEATELYWRAFDKADELDHRIEIVTELSDLYLRTNHFDRMLTKLERLGKELNQERDMTLCLATAHKAAGDLGTARMVLEQLLDEETRDTQLLTQLSELAEQENELEVAADFQRRINEVAPSQDGTMRLANLLLRSGEVDEAETLWTEIVEQEREPHRAYRAVDNLISHDKFETSLKITNRMLRENPQDWEAMFRRAVVLWKTVRKNQAVKQFQQLIALTVDDDQKSAQTQHAAKQAKSRRSGTASGQQSSLTRAQYPPVVQRRQAVYRVNQLLEISDGRRYSSSSSTGMIWTPTDFGQARVAALRGLYSHAEENDKADEFIAAYQQRAKQEQGTEMQARWDLYFLQLMSNNGQTNYKQQFERARELSDSGDPAAMLIYLSSLRLRGYVPGMNYSNELWKSYPPLADDEIDHMLHCYRTLSAKHPSWMVYAGGVQSIIGELTLAKREDAADELYKHAMDSASDRNALANAMTMAASRGNIDDTLELAERLQKRQFTSASSVSQNSLAFETSAIIRLSVSLAERKEHSAVRRLLMRHLKSLRELRASTPVHQRRQSSTSSPSPLHVQVYQANGSIRHQALAYPSANAFFNQQAIGLLHQVYQLHKRDDLLGELYSELMTTVKTQSAEDATFTRLTLAYIRWWENEKDAAVDQLRKAHELEPDEAELRLELAVLEQQLGDSSRALQLIDGMEPTNHNLLKRREILALQLAVLTGDIERARKAAERLFGLRLETSTQMQLAAQMHQLGMHELAEGVLARTRRRAGNQTSTLVSLMQQYQSQGKSEVATQIAHQILRRVQPQQTRLRSSSSDKNAREQAMQVLVRSGQIKTLIQRVEGQLARSPNSTRLHEMLADYYKAAGQKDKAKEIMAKVATLRPDDPKFLLKLAQQLNSSGDHSAACDNYISAIRLDATLIGDDYHNIRRAFDRAKRKPEFAKLFATIDLRKLNRHYYRVVDVAQELMRTDATREEGLEVFRRAWEAFPSNRSYMIGRISVDEVWKLDEMFDYAREGLIPKSKAGISNPWQGISDSLSYSSDGSVTGTLTRVMKALNDEKRRDQFMAEVVSAVEEYPEWNAGPAMLAVLEAKSGRLADSRKILTEMLADEKTKIPGRQGIVIGQELMAFKELNDITVKIYEEAVRSGDNGGMNQFQYSPARRLAAMYAKVGRKDEAKYVIIEALESQDYASQNQYNPGYGEYQQLHDYHAAAEDLLKMDLPVDAVRIYNQATSDPSKFDRAQRYGGSYLKRQIEEGYAKAKKAITPHAMKVALRSWLKPVSKTSIATAKKSASLKASQDGTHKTGKNTARIDLMVMVQPRTLDKARLTSMFETAVEMAVAAEGESDLLDEATKDLEALREQHADDVSVYVADVLVAFGRKNADDRQRAAVTRLAEFLESHPLDSTQDATEASAKTKGEAVNRLSVWIAARLALKNELTREDGSRLADHAVAAAKLNKDPVWMLSILRERGQMALDGGDSKAAEEHWSKILEVIFPEQKNAKKKDGNSVKTSAVKTSAVTRDRAAIVRSMVLPP